MNTVSTLKTTNIYIEDITLITWIFDNIKGGIPIFSINSELEEVESNVRLSAKVYSFLSMINEDLTLEEWAVIAVPENKKALVYGKYIEGSWVVTSILAPVKYSRWLLTYSPDLIPELKQFFANLQESGIFNQKLKQDLVSILEDFMEYCKGIDSLGVTDFDF